MHVLSTHTYRFVREGKDDVIVRPSPQPQLVPADTAEDPYFAMACASGSLKVVELPVPAVAPAEDPAVETPVPAADQPADKPKAGKK